MCASFRARVSLSGGETVPWPRWRNAPGRPSTTPHPVTAVPGSIPRTRTFSRILSPPPLIPSAPTRNAPVSGAQALDFLLRNVDVCRDLLHVVVILEHLEEL